MATNTEKIATLQQKVKTHDEALTTLLESYTKQQEAHQAIIRKLDKLLLIEEQEKSRFESHKLACQSDFDRRYVMREHFSPEVVTILRRLKDEDIDDKAQKTSVISNIVNIVWKLGVLAGIAITVANQLAN